MIIVVNQDILRIFRLRLILIVDEIRKIGGPIKSASAYLMKHPIEQTSDVDAKNACKKFVDG